MSRTLKLTLTGLAALAMSSAAQAGCMNNAYCTSSQVVGSSQYVSSSNYHNMSSQTYGFSGAPSSIPGLGYNESLRATTCPTSVYNPEGGTVLGCYNVVKPVPQTTYYRVVRPVIYVRYPVPVAVPQYGYSQCGSAKYASRYGAANYGYTAGYRSNCR